MEKASTISLTLFNSIVMEVTEVNMTADTVHHRLLVIATVPPKSLVLLIFINYDRNVTAFDMKQVIDDVFRKRFKDDKEVVDSKVKIEAVISSDCLGDLYTLRFPLSIGDYDTKRVWLGGYYPFIPSFIKPRLHENEKLLNGMEAKYKAVTGTILDIISKSNPNNVFLRGEHDPFVFPLSYTLAFNGFTIGLLHSLIALEQKGLSRNVYDNLIRSWRDREGAKIGPRMMGIEPVYVSSSTPQSKILVPRTDVIILGRYTSYKRLKIKNLFTVKASNSLYMRKLKSLAIDDLSFIKKEIEWLESRPLSLQTSIQLQEKRERLRELEALVSDQPLKIE